MHFHVPLVSLYCCVVMLVHFLWTQCGMSVLQSSDVWLLVMRFVHMSQVHTGPGFRSTSPASAREVVEQAEATIADIIRSREIM